MTWSLCATRPSLSKGSWEPFEQEESAIASSSNLRWQRWNMMAETVSYLVCCKGMGWGRPGEGRVPFVPFAKFRSEPPRVQLAAGLSSFSLLSPAAWSEVSGTSVSVLLSITLALLPSRGDVWPWEVEKSLRGEGASKTFKISFTNWQFHYI